MMPKRRDGEPDLKAKDSHSQQIKRRKKPNAAFHDSRIPSVAPLKSKIHDLKRALQHNERMPADVRIEKERALAGYKQDLESAEKEKQKQVMIGRYHMVRFFGKSDLDCITIHGEKLGTDTSSLKSVKKLGDSSKKPRKLLKPPRRISRNTNSYSKIYMPQKSTFAMPSTIP